MDFYLNKNIQVDGNNIQIRLVSILYCKRGLSEHRLLTSTAVMESAQHRRFVKFAKSAERPCYGSVFLCIYYNTKLTYCTLKKLADQ